MAFFSLIQQVNLDEKIKHAPDNGYLIGVLIGYILPFTVLTIIAYWMYYRAKNRKENE
jgi:uncharacterized BrkB/YihY/UPF0761 family membrane protein